MCKILYKEEKAEKAYFIQFFKITSAYGQWFTIGYDFKNSERNKKEKKTHRCSLNSP